MKTGKPTVLSHFAAACVPSLFRTTLRELRLLRGLNHGDGLAPAILIAALIAGEDRRFRTHPGFDSVAIARAFWNWLVTGRIRGASTIEQQLVRTVSRQYQRTIRRKVREILLAAAVSPLFHKDEIASLYLKVAYFGWRMNGYKQACMRLDYDPANLTIEQASRVIAALRWPLPHRPSRSLHAAWEKRSQRIADAVGGWN